MFPNVTLHLVRTQSCSYFDMLENILLLMKMIHIILEEVGHALMCVIHLLVHDSCSNYGKIFRIQ